MKHAYLNHSNGFTLLEILVAISIFAVILSVIFASYTGTFRIIEELESQSEIYEMARIAIGRIQEDLESACLYKTDEASEPGRAGQFVGEDKEVSGRDADTLRFLSMAHLDLDKEGETGGRAEIGYYLKENEEANGLVLYRTDTPEFEEAPEEETGGLILCEGLYSINFTYYNADGEKFEAWDTEEKTFKDTLPVMVLLELYFVDKSYPEEPLRFETGIALPVAGDIYGKTS